MHFPGNENKKLAIRNDQGVFFKFQILEKIS